MTRPVPFKFLSRENGLSRSIFTGMKRFSEIFTGHDGPRYAWTLSVDSESNAVLRSSTRAERVNSIVYMYPCFIPQYGTSMFVQLALHHVCCTVVRCASYLNFELCTPLKTVEMTQSMNTQLK